MYKDTIVAEASVNLRQENAGADRGVSATTPAEAESNGNGATESTGLFASYKRRRVEAEADNSAISQLNAYIKLCDDFDPQSQNVLQFWFVNKTRLNKLLPLALRIFSVPASSAPIERVFSHGGIIMRPHRARLGDTMLSKLIFLKCNNLYEIQSQ